DLRLRAAKNPDGYLVALENERVVGASFAIRTKGRPTKRVLERAMNNGTIAALHRPDGNQYYLHSVFVGEAHRGRKIGVHLTHAQLERAKQQGFLEACFIADDSAQNRSAYHKEHTGATPTENRIRLNGTPFRWWVRPID
ncbi:MAG: GNAT family N-acetyltransferase, partial [Candidatus Micrarchaeota archaeon]|nr:GNAT family N-acetyltransferase [Candidatus Micrarchaeota archaeon]